MNRMLQRDRLPTLATGVVCLALYLAAGFKYPGFFGPRVFLNFLSDSAFLGVVAAGLTFVILTGGIDLSVGAVVSLTSIATANWIQNAHLSPVLAFIAALGLGLVVGLGQGLLIAKFDLPPFLVTLGGLFLCRGLALWVSRESIQIDDQTFRALTSTSLKLPGSSLSLGAIVMLLVLIGSAFLLRQTRFGRTAVAIGGAEDSARLMGLAVERTKAGVYALSGVLAALGGLLFTLYTGSGNALSGTGLELDAIAAVVIGGTLLTGGYGSILGTLLGLLILAILQTAIVFEGTLSSWWTKIVIGFLLLVFVLLQKAIERTAQRAAR